MDLFTMNHPIILVLTLLAAFNSCSARIGRVIGGKDAQDGHYPFVVFLKDPIRGFFCGGSIINKRWVLTAAHCVYKRSEFYICAGENKLTKPCNKYDVETVTLHEEFDFNRKGKDIAVIKVTRDFDFHNPGIKPVVLHKDYVSGNVDVVAVGWGVYDLHYPRNSSENLQELTMQTVDNKVCKKCLYQVTDELCVFNSKTSGACKGDSGSPLVLKDTNTQVGISSWVMGCVKGYPDMYTRISSYINWINTHIDS